MSSYSEEFRLRILQEIKNDGLSINGVKKKYRISRTTVYNWIEEYGFETAVSEARERKKAHYPASFKIRVVEEMRDQGETAEEQALKYHISGKTIRHWEKVYLLEGREGFLSPRERGTKPLSQDQHDVLLAENKRLRVENDYLKKATALVRKKESSAGKNKPESLMS